MKLKNKIALLLFILTVATNGMAQTYLPDAKNLEARKQFQDDKLGMFIHWGPSSLLGAGEWVMNNRNISVKNYSRLMPQFNPIDFDAEKWVSLARKAGMKYIVFITRHHDGFSMWDTQYSDWKITHTAYGKDVLKQLADECKKQGIKLGLYYSLLDWYRSDYPHQTGRTGKGTGRTGQGNYASYLQFMKNQLTELLTNYGEIMSVWFDGHWDQTNVEGSADMRSRLDWKYDEIYALIHRLQPQCLIGNNHHLEPLPGEDFQMFERDLPGHNKSGLSFQKASEQLPLETCETINGSWGFNITDTSYKSLKQLIHYCINAAGLNTNLLLNIGPMANGSIQPEFTDTLTVLGNWMQQYGDAYFGTRGNIIAVQPWGTVTQKDKRLFVHILNAPRASYIFLPHLKEKIAVAKIFGTQQKLRFKQQPEGLFIFTDGMAMHPIDQIIELQEK